MYYYNASKQKIESDNSQFLRVFSFVYGVFSTDKWQSLGLKSKPTVIADQLPLCERCKNAAKHELLGEYLCEDCYKVLHARMIKRANVITIAVAAIFFAITIAVLFWFMP